jgi:site-specific recombinase XerD
MTKNPIKPAYYLPKPLFDTLEHVEQQIKSYQKTQDLTLFKQWLQTLLKIKGSKTIVIDYQQVVLFLYSYRGSSDTFNSYRRELEKLIQWCWFVRKRSIIKLKNTDLENFIDFCLKPPKRWIATKVVARFINVKGIRKPNPEWRPFVVKISKKAHQDGKTPNKKDFVFSSQGIKILFNILSSFYSYLIQDKLITTNPVAQIRQKSRYIRKEQHSKMIRRLSKIQWNTIIKTAINMAEQNPRLHERTLFIMNILYGMYLRISELAATLRWTPRMCDFFRDANGDWWFKTVGKGNKARQVAVSGAMLKALKRWRWHLGLAIFPTPNDRTPLIPKQIGKGPMTSTRAIRMIVQTCFDKAIGQLSNQGSHDEADILRSATVHWLRHTGISDDVKIRPREHVRDDAGHSSSSITDQYIDVELQERAASAKRKIILPNEL